MSDNRVLFGVRSLVISEVLTDPEGANPMTFDTPIPVVGVNSVELSLNQELQVLRGDDKKLATVAAPAEVSFSFQVAKFNLKALALLSGGSVVCGTTTTTFTLTGATASKYFRAVFQSHDDEGNEIVITSNKTKASTISATIGDQQFAQPTWQAQCTTPNGTVTPMFTIEWDTI